MSKAIVSVVRYRAAGESVRRAVDLCGGLDHLPPGARVFIKPNIVTWTRRVVFPKWGVITTSRVMEDLVILLKERGVAAITIGEGMVNYEAKDGRNTADAYEKLGYRVLEKRYGVKLVDVHQRPFEKVDLGEGVTLRFNVDFLESDFLVNVPVMKTHAQTIVSLGIKNLKGLIDVPSRKKCHSADPERDLHYMVARLAARLPPSFTLLDGIYTNERGPMFDGSARRTDALVGSRDVLAADLVGARILGYEGDRVPHLVHAARDRARGADLSGLELVGEPIEAFARPHAYDFPYNADRTLPLPMEKMGIKGLSYRKYDLSLCTYCSTINGLILWSIAQAWKGVPWDDVEILTGKTMKPTPGKKKTILLGQCMYRANKDHPDIREMIPVKGCPPALEDVADALRRAGIEVDPAHLRSIDTYPEMFMKRYERRPEFEESFYLVD